MNKIGFISLGCAKNRVDSEKIMGLLRNNGYSMVSNPSQADYIIINTCGFIDSAKSESIDTILEMAGYKENRCQKLIVMGCLVQRYVQELKEQLPEVDRFITIDEYNRLPEIFSEVLGKPFENHNPERLISTDPWMAYLKIADGCYNKCAYCAIPLIRGSYHSEKFEDVIEEAKMLVKDGVKELVVVAQDTTMYGIDLYKKKRLGELILELDKIEGLHWLRILYLYPNMIDEELIKQLAAAKHFIPYFDIPLQYGSERILGLMNRHGSIERIKNTMDLIRQYFPEAIFRTTLIVGFPTEEEKDFQETLEFVKERKFDRLGAFAYSKEEGTVAAKLKPQVLKKVKEERLKEIMKTQALISYNNNQKYIGKTLEVLVESLDMDDGYFLGRSYMSAPDEIDGYVKMVSDGEVEIGSFVKVKIEKADTYDLYGTII